MPSTTIKKEKSFTAYIIELVVGLFLIFGFGYVCPSWGGISTAGIQTIGIFFGLIYLISTTDFGLLIPGLLGFIAILMTRQYTPATLMAATFGSTTVVQIIFVYVLCQAIIVTGAAEFLAKWLLIRKSLQGKPYRFGFVFIFTSLMLGAFVGVGGIIFMFSLLDSIVLQLGYDKDGYFNKWMSLGSFLAAIIGMAFIPFKGLPLVIFGAILSAMAENGITLNFITYMFVIILF